MTDDRFAALRAALEEYDRAKAGRSMHLIPPAEAKVYEAMEDWSMLRALLDAADERDRLAAALQQLATEPSNLSEDELRMARTALAELEPKT